MSSKELSSGSNSEQQSCSEDVGILNDNNHNFNPEDNNTENFSFNPENTDLGKIRGDAIGNTLYSERFVLSTLIKLSKSIHTELSQDKAFEKELCALWDMTLDEDVVHLLLEHNVLELFAECIETTQDIRLMEILVGIMGNMCNFGTTRYEMRKNQRVMATVLKLSGCGDALTLVQLMRLIAVCLIYNNEEESGETEAKQWLQHFEKNEQFVENLSFIFSNSVNADLLRQSLETLNALLAKFAAIAQTDTDNNSKKESNEIKGCHMFIKDDLINGTIEAFLTLMELYKNVHADEPKIAVVTRKCTQMFINIHIIMSQYDELARNTYISHLVGVTYCLSKILEPLTNAHLMPLQKFEIDVIDDINDLFLTFGDPFDEKCVTHLICIWHLVSQEIEKQSKSKQKFKPKNDFEDDHDNEVVEIEGRSEDLCMTILDYLTRTICNGSQKQIQAVLKNLDFNTIRSLLNSLANCKDKDIKKCCLSIQTAFDFLNSQVKA